MFKKLLFILICGLAAPLQSMKNLISDDQGLLEATGNPYQINMECIELLVKNYIDIGASTLARDEKGWTPLHLSVKAGKIKVVKVLLDAGCPVDIRTDDPLKSTALQIAIVNGYRDIINLLLARGASPNAEDRCGLCPFHTAIIHRDLPTLKLLVARGADLSRSLAIGNCSTLELASEAGREGVSPEIFTYVLEQGATYKDGYEALATKIEKTRPQFAEQLRNYKPKVAHCVVCKSAPEVLKVCGTCKKVRYCNAACQRKDWATHKLACTPAAAQEAVDDCSICLNPLRINVVKFGACGHKTHSACRALTVSNKNFNEMCPLCRAPVPKNSPAPQ